MKGRSYDDGCATAHALDLIGERWALLIVRELLFGPMRFTDLRAGLRSISPNVLAQRLDELEAAAIVRRRKLPPPAASWIYELTEWGRGLEEPIVALGRWAVRSPFLKEGLPMSRAGLLLALRAMYQPPDGGGFNVLLDMPEGAALVTGTPGGLEIRNGQDIAGAPEATVAGTADTLDSVVFGGATLQAAVAAGDARVAGDESVLERFMQSFPLPDMASKQSNSDPHPANKERS